MEKQKTIYCGSGKRMNSKWIKGTININKLRDYIQQFQGHEFVRININEKDEVDQYGKDVSITVDTWEPNKDKQTSNDSKDDDYTDAFESISDNVPF
jgi:hypothetical protein